MALQATGFMSDRHDLVVATPANPAAGSNLSWAVPTNKVVQVIGVQLLLTTTVVAGNRVPSVCISTGGIDRLPLSPSFIQAPNTAWVHYWSVGVSAIDYTTDCGYFISPLACCYQAKPGETIDVNVCNIDAAGDTLTNIRIRYLEWNEN